MHQRPGHRTRIFGALALVGLLGVAACGSSSKSDNGSAGTTGGSAASALGAPNKATGTPVKIGLISDGKSDAIDNSGEINAAKAATQYINDYLGGLNGHPIDLTVCEDHQTPSGATDCTTKMVDAKVAAVLNGTSGQTAAIKKGLDGSNIPLVVFATIDQDTLLKPGSFVLSNGLGSAMAGPAIVGRDSGVKKAGLLLVDVPSVTGPFNAIGKVIYKNAGIDLDIVPAPADTADMTPQVQAEMTKKPGYIFVIGQPSFCTSAFKALKTLGFTGVLGTIVQCIDSGGKAAIPGGYAGVKLVTVNTTDPADKDFKIFSAVIDKYAKGTDLGGVTAGGYIVVTAFARALQGMTGGLTASSIMARFQQMPTPVELPLGGGITFQCGSKPVAITPNICSSKVLEAELQADGSAKNFKPIETADVSKLG